MKNDIFSFVFNNNRNDVLTLSIMKNDIFSFVFNNNRNDVLTLSIMSLKF